MYQCVRSSKLVLVGTCNDPGLLANTRAISKPKTKLLVACRLLGKQDEPLLSGIKWWRYHERNLWMMQRKRNSSIYLFRWRKILWSWPWKDDGEVNRKITCQAEGGGLFEHSEACNEVCFLNCHYDRVIPCQRSERWHQRCCPGQVMRMLLGRTECFPLYAAGHRESQDPQTGECNA